jgi:uncharacterized protein
MNGYNNNIRILEVTMVVITGLGKFLFVDYLNLKFYYVIAACLLWIGYILYRVKQSPGILSYWGFQKTGFKKSLKIILPIAIITVCFFIAYGLFFDTLIFNWHIVPILMLYPCWGAIQQFLIIGLITKNLSELDNVRIPKAIIVLLASTLFAIVHYPSWMLIGATFVLAIFYSIIYLRYNNLWTLGLFHGWLGGLLYFFVLNRDPWMEFLHAVQ